MDGDRRAFGGLILLGVHLLLLLLGALVVPAREERRVESWVGKEGRKEGTRLLLSFQRFI